ncbi:MAG TPA: hypothetical protein DCG28_00595 [Lachnospiraceae bacterium]|nr:hypothetical protein [Lachnospiraceae bacterium]
MDIYYQTLLFDFYSELLTEKQKDIFSAHYLYDSSLNEIASEYSVTKQSVHDLLKRTESILLGYEHKLGLVDKYLKRKAIVEKSIALANDITDNERIKSELLKTLESLQQGEN